MPETKRVLRRQPAPAPTAGRRFTSNAQPAAAPAKRSFNGATTKSEPTDDGTPVRGKTGGWGGYKTTKESAPSKWEKRYEVKDEGEGLMKILEDAPYASVLIHWPDWIPRGQKPLYICWKSATGDPNTECPLCEVGDVPSASSKFNVLDLDGDVPILKVWSIGITLTDILAKFADNPKTGPLSNPDTYYAISKTGTKRKTVSIRPIKSRDLKEDFDFDPPLTATELEEFSAKCWTEDSLDWGSLKELQDVADQMK